GVSGVVHRAFQAPLRLHRPVRPGRKTRSARGDRRGRAARADHRAPAAAAVRLLPGSHPADPRLREQHRLRRLRGIGAGAAVRDLRRGRARAPAGRLCVGGGPPSARRLLSRPAPGTPRRTVGAMTNRLADTLSPYLRAHADNPVDWWPWSADAFEEARRREVPLMISIGYSTCHWCHVMARESFSDQAAAAQINRDFVAVKIDREEHPEVDAAFMAAASAFTQHLGWPLTVFTTPQGTAFYAGTYWPPEARGGTPAFRDVLTAVREAWTDRRAEVLASADAVADALRAATKPEESTLPDDDALRAAAGAITDREDREFGGFGGAPKFPMATALRFLQHPLVQSSDAVGRALTAMSASELHDTVDGGFFRYATQRDWTVPHYERMLIDNAQLLEIAVDAGYADTARDIAGFLLGVL